MKAKRNRLNGQGSALDIPDLLSTEAVISETPRIFKSSSGLRHIFVSSKTGLIAQALYISRHIDRLLFHYHSTYHSIPSNPPKFWLHGIGRLAVTRAIDLALHLEHRMYPGHLTCKVHTNTCSTTKQTIKHTQSQQTTITDRDHYKSAVHICVSFLPTRESRDESQIQPID